MKKVLEKTLVLEKIDDQMEAMAHVDPFWCSKGYLPFADDLDDPTEVCTAVLKD